MALTIEKLRHVAKDIMKDNGHVWLYGSRARGDARPDSDWDLLIIVNREGERTNSDFDTYSVPFIDFGFEHDEMVMPHLYTQSQWKEYSFTPFERNVERDKIVLV